MCRSKADNVSGSDRSIIYNHTGGLRTYLSCLADYIVYGSGRNLGEANNIVEKCQEAFLR